MLGEGWLLILKGFSKNYKISPRFKIGGFVFYIYLLIAGICLDILLEKIDPDKKVYCVIGYCDNLEVSQHIQERLEGKIDCDAYVYMQIGSVVGTHIGMGATGMAFYQL